MSRTQTFSAWSRRLRRIALLSTGVVSLACTANSTSEARPITLSPICYASQDGRLVRSSLLVAPDSAGGERVFGVTELRESPSGTVRAVERAKLDGAGRLVHLEATVGSPDGDPDARVVLDAPSGHVQIITRNTRVEWTVPNDLPWVWVPILTAPNSRAPIATPVVARVELRAAAAGSAVRLLDLGALTSHAVTADQLLIPDSEAGRATVVVADDAVEIEDGVPRALRLAALGTELAPIDAGAFTLAAANVGCAPLNGR
jgi:hypothetical protein